MRHTAVLSGLIAVVLVVPRTADAGLFRKTKANVPVARPSKPAARPASAKPTGWRSRFLKKNADAPTRPTAATSEQISGALRAAGVRGPQMPRLKNALEKSGMTTAELSSLTPSSVRSMRKADAALAAGHMELALKHLDASGLAGKTLTQFETALAGHRGLTSPSFYRKPLVIGPDGKAIPPDSHAGGFHGTNKVDIETVLRRGLGVRGPNTSLEDHVLNKGATAFRGTTPYAASPDGSSGAVLWAGEGGWVFEVEGVATWDANRHLDGQIRRTGQAMRNPMRGEVEGVIPGYVPPSRIKRFGKVVENKSGRLLVKDWVDNPGYAPRVEPSVASPGGP